MNTIDRLLLKVKKAAGHRETVIAVTEYDADNDVFVLHGSVFSKVRADNTPLISQYKKKEDVEAALQALSVQYPDAEIVNIVIDYGDNESG